MNRPQNVYETGMQGEKQTLQSIRNIFPIICSSDLIITTKWR